MKYMIFNRTTNLRNTLSRFNTSQEAQDSGMYDSGTMYIVEFADSFDFTNLDIVDVKCTCSTTDDKDQIVTNFTIVYDYTIFNNNIDRQKDVLLKNWCEDQGFDKCEAYYLRVGVLNGATDADFVLYKEEAASIKASQDTLKLS